MKQLSLFIALLVALMLTGCFGLPEATQSSQFSTTSATTMRATTTKPTTKRVTNTEIRTTTTQTTTTAATTKATTTAATTKATTTAATTKATTTAATTKATPITLRSITSTVYPGDMVTVEIKGKPNTNYDINVYYSSGVSSADGLGNKTSDGNGIVSWSWKVGTSTLSTLKLRIKMLQFNPGIIRRELPVNTFLDHITV